MTRDEKIEYLLELAHRAGKESWGKFRMVWKGSADKEDFQSQAALFLIQAVDRKDWGIDAPGLYYNFILNRMVDWIRNHQAGKRSMNGSIVFCSDKCLRSHAIRPSQESVGELGLLLAYASDRQAAIVRLMLSGLDQKETAPRVGISASLVSRELKALAA